MKLTKENVSAHIEDILNDPDKKQILVNKLIETGLFDMTEEKKKDGFVYDCNYYISNCLDIQEEYTKYEIATFTHHKTPFYFSSRKTAEIWAKKLSALNKLRMIKELIDTCANKETDGCRIMLKGSTYYAHPIYNEHDKSSFKIIFSSKALCLRAIELMGKEALDDLFIEIN